ncbi:hypothetical protein MLD38_021586 [Melastoma candidum]|nr:hypothetical protein MLD38_021586 [Melastoma candidum]
MQNRRRGGQRRAGSSGSWRSPELEVAADELIPPEVEIGIGSRRGIRSGGEDCRRLGDVARSGSGRWESWERCQAEGRRKGGSSLGVSPLVVGGTPGKVGSSWLGLDGSPGTGTATVSSGGRQVTRGLPLPVEGAPGRTWVLLSRLETPTEEWTAFGGDWEAGDQGAAVYSPDLRSWGEASRCHREALGSGLAIGIGIIGAGSGNVEKSWHCDLRETAEWGRDGGDHSEDGVLQ